MDPMASVFDYASALKIAAFNIHNNSKDNTFLKLADFEKIKEKIEKSIHEYSFAELTSIIFFIRTLDSHKIKKVFSKECEKNVIFRAIEETEYMHDKSNIIELYLNLGLIQRTSMKIEKKILEILRNNEYLSHSDIGKILNGAFYSKRVSSKGILMETIKYIENINFSMALNSELIDYFEILQKIDERFSLGFKLFSKLTEIVKERVHSLRFEEIERILNFYSKTDNFERSLLYMALVQLELVLSERNTNSKFLFLSSLKHLAQMGKNGKNIKLSNSLKEKLNAVTVDYLSESLIGPLEVGDLIVNYSYLYKRLPDSFLPAFVKFADFKMVGLWEFLAIRGFSKFNRVIIAEDIIKSRSETHNAIVVSSFNVKLSVIYNIAHTTDYSQEKYLPEYLNVCVTEIMKKIENWSEFKNFWTCWNFRKHDMIGLPELKPIILRSIFTIQNNWTRNEKWFLLKYLLSFYSEEPEIHKKWCDLLECYACEASGKDIENAITDVYDKTLLPAMIMMLKIIKTPDTNSIAHVLSFSIKDLPDMYVKVAADLICKANPDIINNIFFAISKWSVFSLVFSRGYSNSIVKFVEKLTDFEGFSSKNSHSLSSLGILLATSDLLNQKIASKIIAMLTRTGTQRDLHSLIAFYSVFADKKHQIQELLPQLFDFSDNYSINLLSEKINTYLLVPFISSSENDFLTKVEIRFASIELKNISNLLSIIEALNSNIGVHQEFVQNITNIAAEVILNHKEQLAGNIIAKTLGVFAKRGYVGDSFYEELEESLVISELRHETVVNLLITYAKCNKTTAFFEKICNFLLNSISLCTPYSLEIISLPDHKVKSLQLLKSELGKTLLDS